MFAKDSSGNSSDYSVVRAADNIQLKIKKLLLSTSVYQNESRWEELAGVLSELGELYQKINDVEKLIEVSNKKLEICHHLSGNAGLKVKAR